VLEAIQKGHLQLEAGIKRRFTISVHPVIYADKIVRYVLQLSPLKEVIRQYNRLFSEQQPTRFEMIYGEDATLHEAIDLARRVASSTSSVLVLGESGTGKELFARAIHSESNRSGKPFLPVNCAAIPEALLESELFGYEEGAFSGAVSGGRIGRFEQAHHGTLFLDEIGDLPLHLQAKLLRVLQDKQVYKVGGRAGIPVDVRLITATNKPLEQMVRDGEFREDLYYRINVIPITVPPLRGRKADIELLAGLFLEKHCRQLGKTLSGIEPEALRVMKRYDWPGNVRELENAIEYGVHVASGEKLGVNDMPKRLRIIDTAVVEGKDQATVTELRSLVELEKAEIERALVHFGKSAQGIEGMTRSLGISRATLYRKFKTYHL
jgi:transcriptional regulator with PAS, ATPase and Fis domain